MQDRQKYQPGSLSKTRIMDFLQCPRKLWLKLHHPELERNADTGEQRRLAGDKLGELARMLYDPNGIGVLVRATTPAQAQAMTQELLAAGLPMFEACFCAQGGIVYVDILLPIDVGGARQWRMVEVKSSGSVKGEHMQDLAFQAQIALQAGLPLTGVALAHVDTSWVYPGGGDYRGLLQEQDLTAEILGKAEEVGEWLSVARSVIAQAEAPGVFTSKHCNTPYDCGYLDHCESLELQARFPAKFLPDVRKKALKEFLGQGPGIEMESVPDAHLNEVQLRVKMHTLSGAVYFDEAGARAAMAQLQLPAYFLDFETIFMAIPRWAGTRSYQQVPFQYSVHRLDQADGLQHAEFLNLSGDDPSRHFAESLVRDCGQQGVIFVYNASFEQSRVKELAARYADLAEALMALNARMFDLLPVAKACYYHPSQAGSWSIKAVLPAIAPDLSYDALEGVQDGGMAMEAFLEAIAPETSNEKKQLLDRQLREYCKLDTYAMVRLWGFFSGHDMTGV